MSKEEHMKRIGIPAGHGLVESRTGEWGVRKGQDTDTYYYDHVNEAGQVLAKYVVRNSTSIHPPFSRSITHEKLT